MTARIIISAFVHANLAHFLKGIRRRRTKYLTAFAKELDEATTARTLQEYMVDPERWTPARAGILQVTLPPLMEIKVLITQCASRFQFVADEFHAITWTMLRKAGHAQAQRLYTELIWDFFKRQVLPVL